MRPLHLLCLALLAAILCATPATFAADINQKLDTIVLDDIDFEAVPLMDALGLIKENTRLRGPEGKGINIVLKLTKDSRDYTPVTLKLTQPTLRAAVDAFARCGNLEVKTERYAVALIPRKLPTAN
jgi:hypothetical protein